MNKELIKHIEKQIEDLKSVLITLKSESLRDIKKLSDLDNYSFMYYELQSKIEYMKKYEAENELRIVADYLNEDWSFNLDFKGQNKEAYYFKLIAGGEGLFKSEASTTANTGGVPFKNRDVMGEAIRILGSDLIETALGKNIYKK